MELLIALAIASIVLVLIPGPNAALIVANTLKHGYRFGVVTVAGTALGIAIQLALVAVGLAALLEVAAGAMTWIKWAGAAYLLYLGVKTWREPVTEIGEPSATDAKAAARAFWRGLGMSVVNPKTLIFNAAFLPQFVRPEDGPASILGAAAIYLAIIFLGDCLFWVGSAHAARGFISRYGALRNKLSGGFMATAGVGLAFAHTGK